MQIVWTVAIVLLSFPAVLYLGWVVHCTLDRLCVRHARRFCSHQGLQVRRSRWQPQFDASGIKTEYTLVQLECLDAQKQRRLVTLSVWLFGVRKTLSDEPYPDSYDTEWPQASV